jgi:hypothetical protein
MTTRYAKTQDEISAALGISARQFRTYSSRPDAPNKLKSGYNISQWRDFVKSVKAGGLKGDGSLKDEKLLREIERLDIMIAKDTDALVDKREAENEYKRELSNMRKVIDDWEAHETAKQPDHAEKITGLAHRLIDMICERCGG